MQSHPPRLTIAPPAVRSSISGARRNHASFSTPPFDIPSVTFWDDLNSYIRFFCYNFKQKNEKKTHIIKNIILDGVKLNP